MSAKDRGLYAALVIGFAVIAIVGGLAWTNGGLPGTKDSPSATVKGEPTAGRTAAD